VQHQPSRIVSARRCRAARRTPSLPRLSSGPARFPPPGMPPLVRPTQLPGMPRSIQEFTVRPGDTARPGRRAGAAGPSKAAGPPAYVVRILVNVHMALHLHDASGTM